MSQTREPAPGPDPPPFILRPPSLVLLIGLRGSGKTTIGRLAADRLRLPFADLDDRTPALLGCGSVAEAWARHGEPAFREAEVAALRAALSALRGVLALGGGTPMAAGAIELVRGAQRAGARVVYLRAAPGTLRARLAPTDLSLRPALLGSDPLAEIEAVFAARDGVFAALADEVIETDPLDCAAAAEAVAAAAVPPRSRRGGCHERSG